MNWPKLKPENAFELENAINHCHSLALHRVLASRCELALDVNCRDGNSTQIVSRVAEAVMGIDPCPEAIERARKKQLGAKFSFSCSDLLQFNFPERRFDLVSVSCCSSEFQERLATTLAIKQLMSLLKPNGALCVVVMNEQCHDRAIDLDGPKLLTATRPSTLISLETLRKYGRLFEVNTWDVKSTLVNEFRLESCQGNPPFEIMFGRLSLPRRNSDEY